jgi:hypothetical protein
MGQAASVMAAAASVAQSGMRIVGARQMGTMLVLLLQFVGSLVARLLMRIPVIGAIGGAFVGFRKVVQPWMDNRVATAEWERQRQHEASATRMDHVDDFTDMGAAQRYFQANRDRILNRLGGQSERAEGTFDWYAEWEKWARQQWEQQQQQQQQQTSYGQQRTSYGQQQGQQRTQRQPPKGTDYKWDFDPTDP